MSSELHISKIILENYRQYYGTVEVVFPADGNVFSIIVGANGAGKSNLWNAIHWCLFKNEPHLKSGDTPPIFNKKYLLEVPVGRKATMSVELIMESGTTKYRIKRTMAGIQGKFQSDDAGMLIMSSEDPVPSGFEVFTHMRATSFQISKNGETWDEKTDKHSFDGLVNQYIIPKNLSYFFILDGEFLSDLFSKFEHVQSGIDQVSQINVINDAIKYTDNVRFPRRSTGDEEIDSIQLQIKRHEQYLVSEDEEGRPQTSSTEMIYGTDEYVHITGKPRVDDLERSISNVTTRQEELLEKKNMFGGADQDRVRSEHASLESQISALEEQLNKDVRDHTNSLVDFGPKIMCKHALEHATDLIKKELDLGNLPNFSKLMLSQNLLAKELCICGTSLNDGTDARKNVENAMKSVSDDAKLDIVNDMKYQNETFLVKYTQTSAQIDKDMEQISKSQDKLNKLREDEKVTRQQMGKGDNRSFAEIVNEMNSLSKKLVELTASKTREELDIRARTQEKGDGNRRLTNIQARKKTVNEALLLQSASDGVSFVLGKIKERVSRTIREEVSGKTLDIFNSLSWKENYERLIIDDKYRIRMTDKDGIDIVAGMAAGERLFLALSFILALKITTQYKFPLVIDSPLGRTGGNLRMLFGEKMPELLSDSQLVLLATNTEYGNTKIEPEDGRKPEYTLKELFEKKVKTKEYHIDFDKKTKTSTIRAVGGNADDQ